MMIEMIDWIDCYFDDMLDWLNVFFECVLVDGCWYLLFDMSFVLVMCD